MNEHVEHRMAKPTAVFRPNLSRMLKTFVIVLLSSQFFASAVAAQSVNVKLTLNNSTVADVIEKLHRQTGYEFSYDAGILSEKLTNVSVDAKNERIETVLSQVFGKSDITFRVLNNRVFLKSNKKLEMQMSTLANTTQQPRARKVSGTINDNKGEPIIGATIVEKGNTTNGTITDIDGNFTLEIVPDAVLQITYVGYEPQEITTTGKNTFHIVLQEDTKTLDELVVVGYGTLRKRDLTGSVVSLTEGRFTEGINTNALQLLSGKAAGVNISQTSSAPGAGTKIQIRGAGSINSSNAALVVVDGLPGVDPTSISPEDIKSIEVLKDASAAAIYGTRAANGVVLITTKGGEKGEVTVKFGSEFGLQTVAKKMEMLNARQYMETLNAIRKESNNKDGAIFSDEQINAAGEGTNWQDEIFRRSAPVQNYMLSFSGGAPKSDYYLGLNFLNQEGLVHMSDFKKLNVRTNMNFTPKDFLRFKFTLNYTRADRNSMYENMDGVNEGAGPINAALQFDPTLSAGKNPETGRYYLNDYIALDNPLALMNGIKNNNQRNTVYGTFTTEIEPLKEE